MQVLFNQGITLIDAHAEQLATTVHAKARLLFQMPKHGLGITCTWHMHVHRACAQSMFTCAGIGTVYHTHRLALAEDRYGLLTAGHRCTGVFTCTMPGPFRCCCPTASLPLLSFRLLLEEYLTRCGLVLAVAFKACMVRCGGVSALGVDDCDWKSEDWAVLDGVLPFQD